jgi:hypothetical protein
MRLACGHPPGGVQREPEMPLAQRYKVTAEVPRTGRDGADQVFDGGEGAAADGRAGNDAEENLDHISVRSPRSGVKSTVFRRFLASHVCTAGCGWGCVPDNGPNDEPGMVGRLPLARAPLRPECERTASRSRAVLWRLNSAWGGWCAI